MNERTFRADVGPLGEFLCVVQRAGQGVGVWLGNPGLGSQGFGIGRRY